jgi:hypothetical protein
MATQRQIEANRKNARRSTGPRSTSGKERSSQNAVKHGLSKREAVPELYHDVEALTGQIAGPSNNKEVHELARTAAESEIQLQQISQLKIALIERAESDMDSHDRDGETRAIQINLSNLDALRRYELRAAGRRNKAIRKLIRIVSPSGRNDLH